MYQDVIESEWKRCRRASIELAIIEVDIDYFKAYNDTLGHPKGDEVLIQVAKLLTEVAVRPGDSVCRIGGEEFMLILPETSLDGALTVARRLQALLREQAIPHPQSNVGSYITVSAGVGSVIPTNEDYQALVNVVDDALYRAKDGGRNRICIGDVE
jgi:diguanylate cyclase (GGDEF)-like protein